MRDVLPPRRLLFLNTTPSDIVLYSQPQLLISNPREAAARNEEDDSGIAQDWAQEAVVHNRDDPLDVVEVQGLGPLVRHPSALPARSSCDSFLFDFYVNRMCPTSLLFDGEDNGYRNIIPMSLQSSLLMTAVLAVAANHVGFHDPRYHNTASQYKGLTLKSVRRLLAADWQTASKSELLSTILMLCFVEISDQCRPQWLIHLHGANAIARHLSAVEAAESDVILSGFIAPYFAAHNIMAYTAVADPALEPRLLEGGRRWLSRIKRSHREIDSGIGCSAELLSIILDITVRIRHVKRNPGPSTRNQARLWKNQTERRLRNLKQELPENVRFDRQSSSFHDVSAAEKGAEAFKHGAILFLQYLEEDGFHEAEIQHCVDSILRLMKQCPIYEHGARSSAFWPFFIAGCHSTKEGDRAYVLNRFRQLERPKRYGNTRPARKVMEHVWKQRDLRADEPKQQRCGSRCFEWEDAMVQLGSSISLT